MADNKLDPRQALKYLHTELKKRVDDFATQAYNLTKAEVALEKKSPPGFSEETMHKLKREHGEESAFKIAWAAYDKKHGKTPKTEKSEELDKAELCKTCGKPSDLCKCGTVKMGKGMPDMVPPMSDAGSMAMSEDKDTKKSEPNTRWHEKKIGLLPGDKDVKDVGGKEGSGGTVKKLRKAAISANATPSAPKMSAGISGSPKLPKAPMPKPPMPAMKGEAEIAKTAYVPPSQKHNVAHASASAGKLMDTMIADKGGPAIHPGQTLDIKPIVSNPLKPVGARSDVSGGGLSPMHKPSPGLPMVQRIAAKVKLPGSHLFKKPI